MNWDEAASRLVHSLLLCRLAVHDHHGTNSTAERIEGESSNRLELALGGPYWDFRIAGVSGPSLSWPYFLI
jgi:hypothetical protein